jgi:hypothetical protein
MRPVTFVLAVVLAVVLAAAPAAARDPQDPTPPGPGAAAAASEGEPPGTVDRGRSLRGAGAGAAVLGVLSFGVGVYFLQRAEELEDQAEADSASGVPLDVVSDRYDNDGNRATALGFTFTAAGVALGIAGAFFYHAGEARRGTPTVSIDQDGATLGWSTRF